MMIARPRLRLLLTRASLASLFLSTTERATASAQEFQSTGIRSSDFQHVFSEQRNSQWCWAASIQMILNYYGVNITQEQIVRRSYGGSDPFGQLPNWPGSLGVITANLNNWSIDNNGVRYRVSAQFSQGAPAPLVLKNELEGKHPVLIGYMTGPGGGHAVVGTALDFADSPIGPVIHQITVRDPWPSAANRANGGRVVHPAGALASVIQNVWIIRVTKLTGVEPTQPESDDAQSMSEDESDDTAAPEAANVLEEIRAARKPRPKTLPDGAAYDQLLTIIEGAATGDFDAIKGGLIGKSTERWKSTLLPQDFENCWIEESEVNDALWHQFKCERRGTDGRGNEVFARTRDVIRRLIPNAWVTRRTANAFQAQRTEDHGPFIVLNYFNDGRVRLTITSLF